MNSKLATLAIASSLCLSGCLDGTTREEGTSSETQTALQLLADNAKTISSRRGPGSREIATNLGARRSSSQDSLLQSQLCKGYPTSVQYLGIGSVLGDSLGRGRGRDSTEASCSLEFSKHAYMEFSSDSTGSFTFRGTLGFTQALETLTYEGSGSWLLRSGVRLVYERLSSRSSYTSFRSFQKIRIADRCQLELNMQDTLTDTGWQIGPVDAPIVCDGVLSGRFVWDFINNPEIRSTTGELIPARPTLPLTLPEDSLGLSILDVRLDSSDGGWALRLSSAWRLLASDGVDPTDSLFLDLSYEPTNLERTFARPLSSMAGGQFLFPIDSTNFEGATHVRLRLPTRQGQATSDRRSIPFMVNPYR